MLASRMAFFKISLGNGNSSSPSCCGKITFLPLVLEFCVHFKHKGSFINKNKLLLEKAFHFLKTVLGL